MQRWLLFMLLQHHVKVRSLCFDLSFPLPHLPHALQPYSPLLPPRVVAPGAPVAPVTPAASQRTGLPPSCMVAGGTTDSIAAFLAAGVVRPGQAVTSLGWVRH